MVHVINNIERPSKSLIEGIAVSPATVGKLNGLLEKFKNPLRLT